MLVVLARHAAAVGDWGSLASVEAAPGELPCLWSHLQQKQGGWLTNIASATVRKLSRQLKSAARLAPCSYEALNMDCMSAKMALALTAHHQPCCQLHACAKNQGNSQHMVQWSRRVAEPRHLSNSTKAVPGQSQVQRHTTALPHKTWQLS